jgi:NAD-dependent dihydropyrimidine dehydrogenase PreA subunit
VAKAPYEADVLITLPKLKTHAMAYYTGAIKNQFGCIPGTLKATWHTRMPEANNFCKMLLDLNTLVNTSFAILDGIVSMEGNGPKNGKAKNTNTIIMGKSLTAVDSTAVRLIGYENPLDIPLLKEAHENNWGKVLSKDIEIFGENIDNMKIKDFQLCRKGGSFYFINPAVTNFLRDLIAPDPSLIKEKCIGCGRCTEVCPEKPKVLKMINQNGKAKPVWDMKKCIRCFCCQELCPFGAIETKYSVLGKILGMEK